MTRPIWTRLFAMLLIGLFLVVRAGPLCLPAQAAVVEVAANCHDATSDAPAKPAIAGKASCNAICAPLPVEGCAVAGAEQRLDDRPAGPVATLMGRDGLPPLPPPRGV